MSATVVRKLIRASVLVALVCITNRLALAQREMEKLGRGVVAIPTGDGKVFVSWRLFATDPQSISFNLYRSVGFAPATRLNSVPIVRSTNFVDSGVDSQQAVTYFVRPVLEGREQVASSEFQIPANSPIRPYLSIPLQTLPDHSPNDASVGDLDGDAEYEIILKQVERERDNSQAGRTGETKLEAYRLDGRFLWRINLGKNIREGAHYTQFMVLPLSTTPAFDCTKSLAVRFVEKQPWTVTLGMGFDYRIRKRFRVYGGSTEKYPFVIIQVRILIFGTLGISIILPEEYLPPEHRKDK